jgi:hypothetical protein
MRAALVLKLPSWLAMFRRSSTGEKPAEWIFHPNNFKGWMIGFCIIDQDGTAWLRRLRPNLSNCISISSTATEELHQFPLSRGQMTDDTSA